jgi:hypothetical protein
MEDEETGDATRDPLARVKTGSAIALVSEMGTRLDGTVDDWTRVKQARLYALEMLTATACVYFRNHLVKGQTVERRAALADEYASKWLAELLRYLDGREAAAAPSTFRGEGGS